MSAPGNKDEFEFPTALKFVLDASIQQAHAFGTVMGLCSLTLAATASGLSDNFIKENGPDTQKTLRLFLYIALMLNLSGAFMCLMVTVMCNDLMLTVNEKRASPRPTRYKDGTVSALLDKYRMSRWYSTVNGLTAIIFPLAWAFSFVTLALWLNLSQPIGWLAMTVYGPVAVISIFVFTVVSRAKKWS